jgi:predicted restriction endonuclease
VQAGANTYDGAATKPSPSEAPEVLVSDPSADDEQSSEQVPVALDSGDIARFLNNTPAEVLATRMSAQTFRDVVLASYSGRCAITGKALQVGGHLNVEAAHIQPRAHDGSNLPSNGIALSRDLHWGFDKGAFTLKEDLTVEVHPSLMNTDWWEFNGRVLQVPENSFFRPALESIRHHRTRVYGRFLYSGSLRRLDAD